MGYLDHPEDDVRRRAQYEATHHSVLEWDRPPGYGGIRIITSRHNETNHIGACHLATPEEVRWVEAQERGVNLTLDELTEIIELLDEAQRQKVRIKYFRQPFSHAFMDRVRQAQARLERLRGRLIPY